MEAWHMHRRGHRCMDVHALSVKPPHGLLGSSKSLLTQEIPSAKNIKAICHSLITCPEYFLHAWLALGTGDSETNQTQALLWAVHATDHGVAFPKFSLRI